MHVAARRKAEALQSAALTRHAQDVKALEREAAAAAAREVAAQKELHLAEAAAADVLRRAKLEMKADAIEKLKAKKETFISATEWRSALWDLRDEHNPFAATVRKQEQQLARTARGAAPLTSEQSRTIAARVAKLPKDDPLRNTLSLRLN